MIELNSLEQIIADQKKNFEAKDPGIARELNFSKYLKTKQITAISGIRRSGKSTLLKQFSARFPDFYYITFDDERLINFTVDDFSNLMIAFKKSRKANVIFIDEAQNVIGWERFARRLYEEGYKIFITGSNAKLLSSELGTHLTGRYFKIELYPFSFREFLTYKNINPDSRSSAGQATLLKNFDEYLAGGGFPEAIKYQEKEFLKRIYEDVLYKDLIARFKIRETKLFQQLAAYLFSNVGKEISYNGLKKNLGYKSPMSVRKHISFMTEAYLVFELMKYDYSLKKQFISNKKVFVIDNGLRNEIAFSVSEDKGRLLENLVFIELKRRGCEIYYFKNKKECDFLIKEKNKITAAVQVTAHLGNENQEREMGGLLEAIKTNHLKKGLILTTNQEKTIKQKGGVIEVKPLWKWLIGN
ncbi:MAG: ATP-binding protein [Candidatus Magasanikbacteria bacterium]|nr:ATP-binding protein [Candidatus Magasanikbacteria bacterium]